MASIVGPVPNQPVYVWQPSLSSIGIRGSVRGTATRLPVYGNTITGTQTIMLIPVLYTKLDHRGRIFIHGFHLSTQSAIGSTRFRIPLIVRIWNFVMTGINVIANFIEVDKDIHVMATASHNTGSMYHTYMHLGGIEIISWLKLCFTVTAVKKMVMVMYTNSLIIIKRAKMFISDFVGVLMTKLNLKVNTNIADVIKRSTLAVNPVRGEVTRIIKTSANVVISNIKRVASLLVYIANSQLFKTAKMSVKLWMNSLFHVSKMTVRTINTKLEQTIKLSVDLTGQVLTGIMAYIKFLLEGYNVEHILYVRSLAGQHIKNRLHLIHINTLEYTARINVVVKTVRQRIEQGLKVLVNLTKTFISSLLSFHLMRSKKDSQIHIWNTPEKLTRNLTMHIRPEAFRSKLSVFIHTEQFRDEELLVEMNPISWLGETNVRFNPANQPRSTSLNVMITVCETWVLAYLNFVPDELLSGINVRMSTCSHTMSSILQWYLHGGRISNHGKGNEVIFDLGDVDPIGPIPPVPSRQWQGGWVEDPFKGVGYIPSEDSTGYGSPSVQDWLSNVEMYWGNASDPFVKKGGTP